MALIVAFLVLLACWPTTHSLHQNWTNWETSYTHGYVIAAICIYLLWRGRYRSSNEQEAAGVHALPLAALALTGILWVIGVRSSIVAIEWLLLPVLILLAIWTVSGAAAARRSWFAVAFLYFALPLWGSVNALFQWGTVLAVRGMLRLVDIPSHFFGNSVQIPAGTFQIEGGCSGLHYVLVALALAALMGELREDGWRGRIKLMALAGVLAVVTNWIRVFTIILAGHYTDMQHYLVARSHYSYGWVLFAVAMVVFFLLERRMPLPPASAETSRPAARPRLRMGVPALVLILVLAGVAGLQWLSARPATEQLQPVVAGSGWSAVAPEPDGWDPVVHGADDVRAGAFATDSGGPVQRREFLFRSQRQEKELGGYGNDLTGGQVVTRESVGQLAGRPVMLREAMDGAGGSWLVAESYGVGERHYAAPLPAQVKYALQSMARLRSRAATITLWRTPCIPDCEAATKLLARFVETMEN